MSSIINEYFDLYYGNGQIHHIKKVYNTICGVIEGLVEEWDIDGNLEETRNYSNNKLLEHVKFHKNGHLWHRYKYYPDKTGYIHELFYKNGQLKETCNYVNGKIEGLLEKWYNNGEFKESCNYVSGKKISTIEIWNKDGTKN